MFHSLVDFDNTQVLSLSGELDALSSPELRPAVDAMTRDAGCKIKVDLTGLTLLDSSGVGLLVSLFKRTRANRGSVTFVGVTDQPLSIFKLLRLDRVFAMA
jgi:anti-sigma B factor antagonist